jgi:Ca2+-binding RTX toxin-like protein
MEIFGGQGNDTLIGSYGNELISGGAGNDFISGGYGVDTLRGGHGFDTFVILDDTPDQDFKDQWNLKNPEDESIINADNIFKSKDIIKDFEIGVDTLDLSAIVNSGANLSSNIEGNDLSIKNKDNNNFDAIIKIENANFDVSITLEHFGLVSEQTEAELLQSILV